MRKKFKPCFMLMAVVSMIGLFFCTMARACPPGTPGRAREEQTVKDHPEMAKQMQEHWDGKQQSATTTIIRRSPLWFSNFKRKSMQPKNTIGVKTMTEEKNDGEKEVLVPLCVQAANLRDAFEKIPRDGNEETNNALRKSFEAQSAKIIHDWCQEQKEDILKMVGEGFPKDAVVASVQIIATDEYKKAALGFLKSCNPRVKNEVFKLQKLNSSIDANNSIDLSSWQSKRYPVNPKQVGRILDKFSDSNNPTSREAVRIFSLLEAEVLYSATTANLSEDANATTEPKQFESTEAPAPLELPVSTITKAD